MTQSCDFKHKYRVKQSCCDATFGVKVLQAAVNEQNSSGLHQQEQLSQGGSRKSLEKKGGFYSDLTLRMDGTQKANRGVAGLRKMS